MQRVIRLSQIASRPGKPGLISASPSSIWRWVKAGKFPAPFRIGERTKVWDFSEVEKFLDEQRSKVQG